jgi:hypothetical protein
MRSYLGSAIQTSWSPDESLGFGEVLPEYEGGTLTDTRLVEPSGAATVASNHITASGSSTQVSSAQDSRAHEEDAAAPIHVELSTPVELPTPVEPDHGKLSDIDMDRLSAISITSSKTNSFLSLMSLAQRIRLGQTGGTSSGRDSMNDLPSSAIDWYRRSSSLYLFGCRSSTLSIASSQKTNSIRMSWKPEVPITIQEAEAEATQQIQIPQYAMQALQKNRPFCFACNEHFKNKGSLRRHQQEQCEREKIAACSLCPPKQGIFYTKERLLRHHVASHGDKCRNDCSKEKISVPCKEHLSNSFENLPPKKAWGCPYCINCFKTFEGWNGHCIDHLKGTDKAPKWSFGAMIWSLLQQESLREARSHSDLPEESSWSSLNEKTCSGLREVLEHSRLPSGFENREYWYLNNSHAVVRCVLHYIRTGQAFPSQQLFEVCSKPIPYHMPVNTVENPEDFPCTFGEDDIDGRHTRRRGASLKGSLPNLALRPSSSRSPAIQTVAVPPVPPLPDPIPQYRPMSGVVYIDWPWSDVGQI